MKHEVKVNVPPEVQEKLDQTRGYFRENKKAYLFGLGGILIGVAGSRIFSRSPMTQIVVVHPVPTN